MMQRCESCGLDLPLNAHFCTNCGKLLPDRTQAAIDFTNPPAPGISSPNTPPLFSSPSYPGMFGAGMSQEDSGATLQASWPGAEIARNNPQFPERWTDEDDRVEPEILLPWMLPFEGQRPSAGQAPMVQGTPQVGGVPSVPSAPQAGGASPVPGNAPSPAPNLAHGAGSSAPPQAPNWAPHQPVYHPQPKPPLHHPQPVPHPQPEPPLHHPQPEPAHEPKHHHQSGPLHARREHTPRHHSSTSGLTSKVAVGTTTKWLIVAIAAVVVIATSSILLTHAFVPTNPPGITITGSNVVRDGGILHLHGRGFQPGGNVALTMDNGLHVLLAGQLGAQGISQGTGRNEHATGLSQMFILGELQPQSAADTNITVSSTGTFDADVTVPLNFPAGKHTIHATENQGGQSASLQFTVPSPELAVNPTALNFGSIEVGRAVSLSVTVSNQGGSSLHWTATIEGSNSSWLTVPNSSGVIEANGSDEAVTVTANTNGLQPGPHSATLRIHSGNGDIPVPVSLNVTPHAQGSQQAILNVPQQNLDFGQLQAGQQAQQSISIANLGNLPLKWLASTSSTSAGWLSLAPASGTVQSGATPQTVQVNVNSTVLAAGSYTGTINITSNGGNATVTVTFVVTPVTPTPTPPTPSPTTPVTLPPSPSPTTPTPPPPPTWTVSPAHLGVTDCSGSTTWTCTVTLTEDASSQVGINWSSSSDQSQVIFSPASGTLSPGQSIAVTISTIPCSHANFTFMGSGGAQPVTALWDCTPPPSPTPTPQITVTPQNIDPTSSNCSQNSDGTYNCSVTVGETSPGNLNWFAPTGIGGSTVSFNPPSGQLTSSQTQQPVTISSISCSNASFTFTDQNNNTATVTWSCTPTPTPTPPILMAGPTNLLPSICPWHSEAFLCTMTLSESANSQGNLNWTASTTGSASITPSSGTLTPGQSTQVSVFVNCDSETLTFTGPGNTVSATWRCPTVTVNPTALNSTSSSCSLDSTGKTYTCTVTLTETADSPENASWIADSGGYSININPASGTLSPGQTIKVQITNIPCQNFTIGFYSPYNNGGVYLPVTWTCP